MPMRKLRRPSLVLVALALTLVHGCTAVLVKYTGHAGASGLDVLAFYAALSDSRILPILYYHFPGATGLKLRPSEIAAILRLPMVIGIKESILDLREVAAHIRLTHGEGKVFFSEI